MKNEAVKRMKMLNILPQVIKEFKNEGVLEVSERINKDYPAALYWVKYYDGLQEAADRFEEDHNALVYHISLTRTEFGNLFSFLYVSHNRDEWANDRVDIRDGEVLAYVWNPTYPENSGFGYIGINPAMGGVERIW